jgi:hypothetical protein
LGNLLLGQSSCVLLRISFLILRFLGLVCELCSELSFPQLLSNQFLLNALFLGNLTKELAVIIRNQVQTARLAILFKRSLHFFEALVDMLRLWTCTNHAVFTANLLTKELEQVLV